jgi:hypothetical protein
VFFLSGKPDSSMSVSGKRRDRSVDCGGENQEIERMWRGKKFLWRLLTECVELPTECISHVSCQPIVRRRLDVLQWASIGVRPTAERVASRGRGASFCVLCNFHPPLKLILPSDVNEVRFLRFITILSSSRYCDVST